MILDNYQDFKQDVYPVTIFGSGPAGISIALELEKQNIKSVIIEAGPKIYDFTSQTYYKSHIEGDILYPDMTRTRLRHLGGTSGHWGGMSKSFTKNDYRNWGFNFDEFNNYAEKTCKILDIENSFPESKLDSNFNQIKFQWSKVRFNEKYFDHIQKSKNILLILNTQLSHFAGSNKKINYALCINKSKKIKITSNKFILCCGGIENSRILLWSKENNKQLFNSKLPIGNYWMTHYWILGGVSIIKEKALKKFMGSSYMEYDGPLHISYNDNFTKNNKLQVSCWLTVEEDKKFYKEIIKDILCIAPKFGKKIANMVFNKSLKCGNIFMHIEEKPIFENSINLSNKEKDPNNIPITKIIYKSSMDAKKSAREFLKKLGKLFQLNDLGRLAMLDELDELKQFKNLGNHHHMGGTRMGIDLNDSVVDTDLKVHEIDNLYISGSSIFRTSTYKNPTFQIVQFSLRLADKIKSIL